MNRLITILFILIGTIEVWAQDPQYTQFYANPLYLNPAFAGATSQGRLSANYRNQWPSLAANFITYSASYDQYLPGIRSGIGAFINHDRVEMQGNTDALPFNSTMFSGYYSYVAPLNDKLALQLGLSAGVISRTLNFNNLIFYDQLNLNGSTRDQSAEINALLNSGVADRRSVLDFGTGFLLYSENLWLGVAASHLNQPDMSISGEDGVIPMKLSLHGGYKIEFSKLTRGRTDENDMSITPAFMYKRQGASQQLSLGAYFNYQPIMLGFWYRGIPFDVFEPADANTPGAVAASNSITNQDAIALLVGISTPKFTIGYSYDITTGNGLRGNTGGTHEISITYHINTDLDYANGRPRRSRFGRLYCPNPWKQYEKKR
ncbi:MAG: PorP/SprF family type IX secretion system membrane protein [Flammeovirgaceae bacterium]